MFHLHKIIGYLNENRIKIYASLFASNRNEDYIGEVNLQKENFGVSIILPRTLVEDRKIIETNKLEKIIQSQNQFPKQAIQQSIFFSPQQP